VGWHKNQEFGSSSSMHDISQKDRRIKEEGTATFRAEGPTLVASA
jgi:hypothetical protein